MWVPTLLSLDPPGGVPTGCVFSAMMMAITIGGMVYPPLQDLLSKKLPSSRRAPEACASFVYMLAAMSMAVSSVSTAGGSSESALLVTLASFLVFEGCVGLFMPVAGTLRSKYVPDSLQGAILNIFRLPLNAVVVGGTYATDVLEAPAVFQMVSLSFLFAAVLQGSLMLNSTKSSKTD
jgi:MFS transporter, MFS domain-containing protein family, molybdate-anion transporter